MLFPRSFLALIIGSLVAMGSFGMAPVVAETVAMIGTGEVASALGPEFAALGHRIIYGSRNPDRPAVRELLLRTGKDALATGQAAAAAQADIVVLAVPWSAVQEVLSNLGDLSDKIVIDPTNPRVISNDGLRDYAVASSNAEMIQAMAPEAKVVKAFNTMGWETMVDPASSGGPITVPLVGNDQGAKDTVAAIIEGMGLEVVDLGPIRYAHVVEGLYLIWGNARALGTPFQYHFRKISN
ncbi:uncharacterized protein METZ01_LOCUS109191 [marine metagenome]|uniref:Pyrroline-5-carboxylate reductase catalytic N-terminal domain-containing protein n=1 Tax=marine metagenome TaxID=408172 RepID=A0A381WWQ5_9ZZZZ